MAIMKIKTLLPLSLLLMALPAIATNVYITIDENGNRVFSDQPSSDATKHKVRNIHTIPAVKVPGKKEDKKEEPTAFSYSSLRITSPEDGTVIHRGMTGNFTILSTLKPALQAGDDLVLLLNGQVHSRGSGQHWQLSNMDRGEHSLQVQVRSGKDDEVLITSQTIRVIVQRNSIN